MKIAGIDPGVTGAVAILEDGQPPRIFDTPAMVLHKPGSKSRTEYDLQGMAQILERERPDKVVIEEIQPMQLGSIAAFSIGGGYKAWLMACAIFQLPVEKVSPQKWKKLIGLPKGADKEASRLKALEHFPEAYESIKLKKDHNKAEALLIALYGSIAK